VAVFRTGADATAGADGWEEFRESTNLDEERRTD
jgi:hypothetical protein